MPVLHDHQTMTESELQDRHAKSFHDGRKINEITGLHWHLGFPEDVTGEKCPLRDEATSELSLFACASAIASFDSHDTSALKLMLDASAGCFFSCITVPDAEHRSAGIELRSFLQTILTEVPLSAVTGVCLV